MCSGTGVFLPLPSLLPHEVIPAAHRCVAHQSPGTDLYITAAEINAVVPSDCSAHVYSYVQYTRSIHLYLCCTAQLSS